jgi:hypothetical protein
VEADDGVSAPAVLLPVLEQRWLETFEISEMSSSIVWLVVMAGAASSSVAAIFVPFDDADFVFRISGSSNNIRLAGYQPRSRMAVLFVSILRRTLAKPD